MKGQKFKMIWKISNKKWFILTINLVVFCCTLMFSSCYTSDIVKPEAEIIKQHMNDEDDLESIKLKTGQKVKNDFFK